MQILSAAVTMHISGLGLATGVELFSKFDIKKNVCIFFPVTRNLSFMKFLLPAFYASV